ncbi:MAG TPA: hypothetical protein VGR61_11590, partial [Candidatus Dormibacteraeota bacterium]|nr:hypothetical protein [Candidatus Dormibacteraeota bacterium]
MAAESGFGLPGPGPVRSGANPPLADSRSPLERAIQDIHATVCTPTHATLRAAKARALVAQLDGLIGELEEVHLRGGIRVPDRIVARLERFLDSLPEEFRGSFALRTKVIYVLDDLFETQDLLLNLKVPGRHTLATTELALTDEPGRHS